MNKFVKWKLTYTVSSDDQVVNNFEQVLRQAQPVIETNLVGSRKTAMSQFEWLQRQMGEFILGMPAKSFALRLTVFLFK